MQINVSNSPELGSVPKPSKRSNRVSIGWILLALGVGVVTGGMGTIMHLNSFWTGSFGLPWGVALALLIAALGQWWVGLGSANMLAPGITGIAQYATLAVMVGLSRGDHFSVPLNAQTWEFVPHLVIASLLWHAGLVVLTMLMVILVNRQLRRAQHELAQQPIQVADLHPPVGAWDTR